MHFSRSAFIVAGTQFSYFFSVLNIALIYCAAVSATYSITSGIRNRTYFCLMCKMSNKDLALRIWRNRMAVLQK